jgi:hypothetical protein
MSDMTSLSNEYAASADFATEVNSAVLALKRAWSRGEDAIPAQAGEELRLRGRLGIVLLALVRQLSAEERTEEAEAPVLIPEDVIERLEAKHRTRLNWYLEDLRQTAVALQSGAALEEPQLERLDEVCDAADATASASFRRLWRR